jgi:hypothetical protein
MYVIPRQVLQGYLEPQTTSSEEPFKHHTTPRKDKLVKSNSQTPDEEPDEEEEPEPKDDTALHSGADTWGDPRYEDQNRGK